MVEILSICFHPKHYDNGQVYAIVEGQLLPTFKHYKFNISDRTECAGQNAMSSHCVWFKL